MTKYLISFDDGAMTFSEEELPDVAEAAHAVVQEAKNAGVWVFGGGLKDHEEASVVATDGTVTDGPYPGRASSTSADSRSSTCPHARRRWSGLRRSPSPATVLKTSASSCLTDPSADAPWRTWPTTPPFWLRSRCPPRRP
jgi:hypothetical protein